MILSNPYLKSFFIKNDNHSSIFQLIYDMNYQQNTFIIQQKTTYPVSFNMTL